MAFPTKREKEFKRRIEKALEMLCEADTNIAKQHLGAQDVVDVLNVLRGKAEA
jgi:hypothetical protein